MNHREARYYSVRLRAEQTKVERNRPIGGRIKRLLDVFLAVAIILIMLPVLLGIWLLVRITDGSPSIIRHRRIGFRGKEFECLKFRTMVKNPEEILINHLASFPEAEVEWKIRRKLEYDPRVTSLGNVLRKTSLDELPQLINIALGDMSLIGPRPITSEEISYYGVAFSHYVRARPGLTGVWQVSGRNRVGYPVRVEMDSAYVQNWSLGRDAVILIKTIPALLDDSSSS